MNSLIYNIGSYDKKPYLSGVYLLKIGKDIRINPQMMSGLNIPTNFTFKVNFSNAYNPLIGLGTSHVCQFTTIAFFPSFYQISPTEGLLRNQNITVSEKDMLEMINNTNQHISEGSFPNRVEFNHKEPLMIGSGWFGSLMSAIPRFAPAVSKCVTAVSDAVRGSGRNGRGK
jgi:hypothetical protein